jgi:hypothetical protein
MDKKNRLPFLSLDLQISDSNAFLLERLLCIMLTSTPSRAHYRDYKPKGVAGYGIVAHFRLTASGPAAQSHSTAIRERPMAIPILDPISRLLLCFLIG